MGFGFAKPAIPIRAQREREMGKAAWGRLPLESCVPARR